MKAILFFIASTFASLALAGEDKLLAKLESLVELEKIAIRFEQNTVDASGEAAKNLTGMVYVDQRKQRFAIHYDKPDAFRVIGDQKKVALYDVELEQAVLYDRKAFEGQDAIFSIFINHKGNLKKSFRIKSSDNRLTLTSKKGQVFNLYFLHNTLTSLKFRNNLDENIVIAIQNIQKNPRLKESVFSMTFPKNVDVIRNP